MGGDLCLEGGELVVAVEDPFSIGLAVDSQGLF